MNNLTLFLLGLVLINLPACVPQNNNQCFSLTLNPFYLCCKDNKIVYTDESNKWCGIGNGD